MNRWGYAFLGLLVVVLAAYLIMTPDAPKERFSSVWTGEQPTQFTLRTPHYVQEVGAGTVLIEGLRRPADESRISRLWQVLKSMRADRYTAVNPADLAAYGIGEWSVSADGVDIRWGQGNGQSYVYIGDRGEVAIMNDGVFASLNRVASRMDRNQLVDPSLQLKSFTYEEKHYQPNDRGEWYHHGHTDRPPVSVRIQALQNLVSSIALTDFSLQPASPQERANARQSFALGYEPAQRFDVIIFSRDSADLIQVGDLPVQELAPAFVRSFDEALADFSSDPLFDLRSVTATPMITRAEIWRDGNWWFTLESETDSFGEERTYSLLWSGGRDDVDSRAPWWLQDALNDLIMQEVAGIDDVSLSAWEKTHEGKGSHLHVRAWGLGDALLADLHLYGDQARNRHYQGQLTSIPDFFQELEPSSFLKRRILSLEADRISKLQRVFYRAGAVQPEVFRRTGADWQQIVPADKTVHSLVIQRIIGSIVAAESSSVRMGDGSDERKAAFSLALRIAGKSVEDDRFEVDLMDTIDRDWGLRFYERTDGDWDAVLADGSATYHLQDNQVRSWFESAQSFPVLPVLANEISSMRMRLAGEDPFDLVRNDANGWSLRIDDTKRQEAEVIEVRRFLAQLTNLNALRQDDQAAILGLNEREHSMTFYLSQGGADVDRIILSIGPQEDAEGGPERVLSVHREGIDSAAWGRFWVKASVFDGLLIPARRFLPLEQL